VRATRREREAKERGRERERDRFASRTIATRWTTKFARDTSQHALSPSLGYSRASAALPDRILEATATPKGIVYSSRVSRSRRVNLSEFEQIFAGIDSVVCIVHF